MKIFATSLFLFVCSFLFIKGLKSQFFVDSFLFKITGKTFSPEAEVVDIKRLNLLANSYDGKKVIIEGSVDEIDDNATHFLLLTESSKILAFCDKIILTADEISKWKQRQVLKVLGVFHLSNKGYPYITAHSVYSHSLR
jgi:hypothetical protein